ncbi:MAG TPA: hypothetical protein VLQ65_10840 [Saliniramus sp.]|nr:hypothetical protein [Saliniramus sp.]
MTNKSMLSREKALEKGAAKSAEVAPRGGQGPTDDTFPDSPQLKPELDEPRTRLQKPQDRTRRGS